mgnify:FL=1
MNITIVGLGGVGGIVGGRLAAMKAPDHRVIFWCRGDTLRNIREKGLILEGPDGTLTARPALATCDPEEAGIADVLIFATKGHQLEEAARATAPLVSPSTRVLPLLNGVSATAALGRVLPSCDLLSGCIYVSSHTVVPGSIRQVGAVQRILFGNSGLSEAENRVRYADLEHLLRETGIQVTLTERIDVEVWAKFLFLSPLAAATTFYRKPIGAVVEDPEGQAAVADLVQEAEALARALAVPLPQNIADLTLEKARSFAPQTKTSMQLDQEQGKVTELEFLVGYVCREARARGISTPVYDRFYEALKAVCKAG